MKTLAEYMRLPIDLFEQLSNREQIEQFVVA